VRGAYVGDFQTAGRILSGAAAPGIYYIGIRGMNTCGLGVATAEQTVLVP
jgi:hypothetical protein